MNSFKHVLKMVSTYVETTFFSRLWTGIVPLRPLWPQRICLANHPWCHPRPWPRGRRSNMCTVWKDVVVFWILLLLEATRLELVTRALLVTRSYCLCLAFVRDRPINEIALSCTVLRPASQCTCRIVRSDTAASTLAYYLTAFNCTSH